MLLDSGINNVGESFEVRLVEVRCHLDGDYSASIQTINASGVFYQNACGTLEEVASSLGVSEEHILSEL